jgi:hypothetical protein
MEKKYQGAFRRYKLKVEPRWKGCSTVPTGKSFGYPNRILVTIVERKRKSEI